MAPKRGRKKVAKVVKTTKVVEETVEVSLLGSESQDELAQAQAHIKAQEITQTPTRVSESREERSTVTTKTIPIESDDDVQEAEAETETQEPELPIDEPELGKIPTPPRDESQDQPNKRSKKEFEKGQKEPMEEARPNKRGRRESGKAQNKAQNEKKKKGRKTRMREMGEGREGYKRYIHEVLKQVHPGMAVSEKAMRVINNLMSDMFEKLANEASRLCMHAKRNTISAREIQGAVKLVLPGELGKHALAEGTKAVTNYINYAPI